MVDQDYPRLEHIVIDGGSKDGSRDILERRAHQLAYWISEPDLGQTEALNKGLARATGDFLAWLNSDDVLFPGTVRKAVDYLTAHPEVGMAYGGADYIDAQGRTIGRFPAAPLARLQGWTERGRRGGLRGPHSSRSFPTRY